jgi:hypothetical protein
VFFGLNARSFINKISMEEQKYIIKIRMKDMKAQQTG